MSDVVQLGEARQRFAIARANDERDLSMIAEVERRFAEAMRDVAELGGVSIEYLDTLMRASWGLSDDSAGGGRCGLTGSKFFACPRWRWATSHRRA